MTITPHSMSVPLTLGRKLVILPVGPKCSETVVALVALGPDALVPQHTGLVEGPAAVDAVNHPARLGTEQQPHTHVHR